MTSAEAMVFDPPSGEEGVAKDAVRRLRKALLVAEDGARLGSEEELRLRFALSRPTLRQAARVLQHEQLLVVRRGVGGGYYARRPSVQAVAHAAALYLQAHRASMSDVVRIAQVFAVEVAMLASASRDEAGRAHLGRLRAEMIAVSEADYTPGELMHYELALRDAMLALADAPVLELFQRTVYDFGRQDRSVSLYRDHPERRVAWRRARMALIEAVLAQDAEMAALLARRANTLSQSWIDADRKGADQTLLKE